MTARNHSGSGSVIGKTCPYCQYPLKDENEAVICGACGIPHHRECWDENGGCTTFGCVGTVAPSGAVWGQAIGQRRSPDRLLDLDEYAAEKYCHNCGMALSSSAGFCGGCGARVISSPVSPTWVPQLALASVGRRFGAMLVDLFIAYLVVMIVGVRLSSSGTGLMLCIIVIPLILSVLVAATGRTLGKRALGLKVVSADGGPVSWGQAFIRETVGKFLSGFFLLGYVTAIGDVKKQTWHDHIARTLVVDARSHA